MLRALGFDERIRGDHHIFTRSDISEIINVQPHRAMSKVYQIRQIRQYIYKYNLGDDLDD